MQKRTGNIIDQFILPVMSVLIVVLPFVADKRLMFPTQSGKFFLFAYGILIILFLLFFQKLFEVRQTKGEISVIASEMDALFKISFIDMALFVWFIYISVRVFSSSELYGLSTQYLELCGLGITYCIVRSLNGRYFTFLFIAMMIAGTAQAIYGHLQLYSVFPSHHPLFRTTGGFFNPGHFAGYLAVIFPIALSIQLFKSAGENHVATSIEFRQSRRRMIEVVSMTSVITILLVMPATRSRAAWLALIVSSAYLLYVRYQLRSRMMLWCNTVAKRLALLLICAVLIGSFAMGLYVMKRESANGRMLIWKVSASMIKDKPVFGHGYDRYKANYSNYQARYFQDQGENHEAVIADDTSRAFNEFIEITAEEGIVGLLLILTIMYLIFFNNPTSAPDKREEQLVVTCKAALFAFAAFACFSYPSEILPLKLSLVVCIAGVAKRQKKTFIISNGFTTWYRTLICRRVQRSIALKRSIALIGVAGTAWSFVLLTQSFDYHKIWKSAFALYQMGLYDQSLKKYQQVYAPLRFNGDYLIHYGKACSMAGEHDLAIQILRRADGFFPSSTLNTALGDSYKATGNYRLAEEAYLKAADMLPDRFYAKYLLAKLYVESGQTSKAIMIAKELLRKVAKVQSIAVDEIKKEMKVIVEKSESGSS